MFGGYKKLAKDYDVAEQSGFAGTHGLWATYNAVHKRTQTPATVWVFEKKSVEKAWFKKKDDAPLFKKLIEYLKLDALPPAGLKAGIELFERLEEDNSYMVYVTERIVGSLLSLYYQLGDLTIAKNATFSQDPIESKSAKALMKLTSPDTVLYGVSCVLQDLATMHEASVVHGNVSPANIVVTPTGEWRLCGFGFSENSAFQFEFNADYNAFFRPAPAFMTPRQVSSHVSSAQTDTAQLFNSVFAMFGNRTPHFDFQTTRKDKVPSGDQLVQAIEKLCGTCPSGQPWSMNPQLAGTHASYNIQFWQQFSQNAKQYYPLQYLQPLVQVIQVAAGEQATAGQILSKLEQLSKFVILSGELSNLAREGAFSGKVSTDLLDKVMNFITKTLVEFVSVRYMTLDFIQTALFERLVQLLSQKDYHQYVIPLLIQMNDITLIPLYQLFLLFEPIVISCTKTQYRSLYPQANKQGPLAAWSGVQLEFGGAAETQFKGDVITVKYTSPYNDMPLEPKLRDRDRERWCPNFDKDLDSDQPSVLQATCTCIYQNLLFFFNPKAGGRSHYYTLNFVMGCIASQNNQINGDVLQYVSDVVQLFTDRNWMMEESQLIAQKAMSAVNDAMANIGSKFNNLMDDKKDESVEKDKTKPQLDYKQPITAVLTPCIGDIIKKSSNAVQMANALTCLGKLTNYFTDDQIGRILLPNINDALDNIQKFAKSIVGFCSFSKAVYRRCSGKTIASMFLPRILRMLYVNDLLGQDLETCRAISDELYQYITDDVYKKASSTYGQQQAPQQNPDPWGQKTQQAPQAQQPVQQPPAPKSSKEVWGQPVQEMPDPWAQQAQPQTQAPVQQDYQQPQQQYQQPAAKTKDEYGFDIDFSKQAGPMEW